MSKYTSKDGWVLVDSAGDRLNVGDSTVDFRGDFVTIVGLRPPHKEASSGHVTLATPNGDGEGEFRAEYYAGVINAHWVHEDGDDRDPYREILSGVEE
jgi:hypothetical protein